MSRFNRRRYRHSTIVIDFFFLLGTLISCQRTPIASLKNMRRAHNNINDALCCSSMTHTSEGRPFFVWFFVYRLASNTSLDDRGFKLLNFHLLFSTRDRRNTTKR